MEKVRTHKESVLLLIVLVLLALIILLGYIYQWSWVGLTGTEQVTVTKGNMQIVRPTAITLWQWIQVLIVPLVLALGGYWFSRSQNQKESLRMIEAQEETELRDYFNSISELLLHEHLLSSKQNEAVRVIATALTLLVCSQLNGIRKGRVIVFLYNAGLLNTSDPIISLRNADLSGIKLYKINFTGINLSGAILDKACLSGCSMTGSDLSECRLKAADLSASDLSKSNLREAYMNRAILDNAELNSANLTDADVGYASLCEADFEGADMHNVSMFEAILDDANLKGVKNLTDQLKTTKSMNRAILPDDIEIL